jgi:dynein assembly factor with WDR repeat domains 1
MQLRRIYLRYFPPALRLEYSTSGGELRQKTIDLLHVSAESNLSLVVQHLIDSERLLTRAAAPKLRELLHRLVHKQLSLSHTVQGDRGRGDGVLFQTHSVHRPHQLPMTNMAVSKTAKLIATASYDKTIHLVRPFAPPPTKSERPTDNALVGHDSVVFCLAFRRHHSDLLLSGSFDKTCRLWDVRKQSARGVYRGHEGEVVSVEFAPGGDCFGSCSMDCTAIVWDAETETERFALTGHSAEVSCLAFDSSARLLATGSCDSTVRLWDSRYGGCFRSLEHHDADVSSVMFDYQGNLLLSASADGTCKLWDVRSSKCLFDWDDHGNGQVASASFNASGALVVSCGSNGTAFIYDTLTGTRRCMLAGHSQGVTRASFSMQGSQVLTTSADCTARVWNAFSGECVQVLRGHEEEVVDGAFSYDGRAVVTFSLDNSIRVWK